MLSAIEQFYENQEESTRECLLFLKNLIQNYNEHFTQEFKYGLPFFYYKGKGLCYFWKDKKTKLPYIGFMQGKWMTNPALVSDGRKQIRILNIDPKEDIDIELINELLIEAISLRDQGIK